MEEERCKGTGGGILISTCPCLLHTCLAVWMDEWMRCGCYSVLLLLEHHLYRIMYGFGICIVTINAAHPHSRGQ